MNCMKCGQETQGEDVFCLDCLTEMQRYPVEPGTVVLLPRRKDSSSAKKAPKRHTPAPEELVSSLRRQNAILLLVITACAIAIALMFKPTMHYIKDEHYEIGQNYSSVTPSTPAKPEG